MEFKSDGSADRECNDIFFILSLKLLDGDTNWPAVMKALDNAGYTGWATSEQPGNQAADVETARDLAQRMDRILAL